MAGPHAAGCICVMCEDHRDARTAALAREVDELRGRLVNIYHLTLNYSVSPAAALLTIRKASGPGAPAPTHENNLSEHARALLEAAGRIPPRERFEAMVRAGLIDGEGRVCAPAPTARARCTCRAVGDSCEVCAARGSRA